MKGLVDFGEWLEENLYPRDVMYEVGVFAGESVEIFAPYFGVVHCIDTWNEACGYPVLADVEKSFDIRAAAAGNMVKHLGFSKDEAAKVLDGSVDFVYIDANHTYDCVKEDIGLWAPKVRSGGILGGHDYIVDTPDVIRAVDEVFGEPMHVFGDTSWIVRKP
jgi:hypothetical protein